jgi:glycosyltransferase involved in cell wall biosynthesis
VVYTKARPLTLTEHLVLPAIIKREKVDVFHAPSFVVPLYLPCKTVITLHDLTHIIYPGEFNRFVQIYYRIFVKHAVSEAKMIIADSRNTKKDIVKWTGKPESRVRVIPLAVEDDYRVINDENALKQCKLKYKLNKPYILYNGSKKPHKNLKGLIEAFSLLKMDKKIDCCLVIVGKRDNTNQETDYSAIDAMISKLDLQDSIVFTGGVHNEDLALLYNSAEVFAFASLYEGFGLPPLEAMSCGCPVVVSNSSSLPEVCGDAAQYVDPYNIDDIANGIYKVLLDHELRESLVGKGLSRKRLFSWKKCAEETLSAYCEVNNQDG